MPSIETPHGGCVHRVHEGRKWVVTKIHVHSPTFNELYPQTVYNSSHPYRDEKRCTMSYKFECILAVAMVHCVLGLFVQQDCRRIRSDVRRHSSRHQLSNASNEWFAKEPLDLATSTTEGDVVHEMIHLHEFKVILIIRLGFQYFPGVNLYTFGLNCINHKKS